MTAKPLFPGHSPLSFLAYPAGQMPPALGSYNEGQLAGWTDAGNRAISPAPSDYADDPLLKDAWERGYRNGREAFLAAWEKDLFVKADFQAARRSRPLSRQPHWLVPLRRSLPGEPVAYLLQDDDAAEPKAVLIDVPTNGEVACFEVYAGGRRIAAITGDFAAALKCAAQLLP